MEHTFRGYRFRATDDLLKLGGTGKIINGSQYSPEYFARFRGSLLALFGKPAQVSTYSDEAFDYVIEVVALDGQEWVLSAYFGASGPAIGGPAGVLQTESGLVSTRTKQHEESARVLLKLIEATPPANFYAVDYDNDTDNTVRYGILDGDYFYEEARGNHLQEWLRQE